MSVFQRVDARSWRGLQQPDNADRLLLLELVAEDELVLVDGDDIGRLATTSDGCCEVCLDGPDDGCSIYD